MIMKEEEID